MARFKSGKIFGRHAPCESEDAREAAAPPDGEDLPSPRMVKLQARRALSIREASAVLTDLPSEGESLHCLCTARMDLTDVIGQLFNRLGAADAVRIATLSYNAGSLTDMLAWIDQGAVERFTLMASKFFRSYQGELWQRTLDEFALRNLQGNDYYDALNLRAACCYSHAKVVTLAFPDGSKYAIEGSANLCGNGSGREQFMLVRHAGIHDFHARWIEDLVTAAAPD